MGKVLRESYIIREAKPDDKKFVLDLLNQIFSGQQRFDWFREDKFWKWKYESNVFGETIIHVIEHENKIVGSSALWPWKFSMRGEDFFSYQPCDTAIHFNHQGKGLFSLLNAYRIPLFKKQGVHFVFNFPNKKSLSGNLNYGWNYMKKLPWMLKILHPIGTLQSLTSKDKSTPIPLKPEDEINPQWCAEIADDLIYFNKYISTYREKGFFEWRYMQHPYFHYGQVVAEKGRKKATAIYSVNLKGKSRELIVVDILGNPAITDILFEEIHLKASKYNVDYIVALCNPQYQMNKLWKKGYIKLSNKNMVILPFDIRLEDKISKIENWNLIASMHDSV
jgi:hypothetical protein